jgi:hypothetical protein
MLPEMEGDSPLAVPVIVLLAMLKIKKMFLCHSKKKTFARNFLHL